MSDISELEQRITAAMDRIRRRIEAMPESSDAPAVDAGEVATLRQALDDEKTVNQQLEERVKTLKTRQDKLKNRQDKKLDVLEQTSTKQADRLAELDAELQKLRATNDQLRNLNGQLRAANETGVGEPHLINKAMMAELEALRAVRSSDRAEVDAIIAELEPIVGGAA